VKSYRFPGAIILGVIRQHIMNEAQEKLISIFLPDHPSQFDQLKNGKLKLAQYTSAEAAASIISNRHVWLRNSQCMNDYSEIQHGLDRLVDAYRSDDSRNTLKSLLERLFPGSAKKLEDLFNGWIPHFKNDTYITCLSEHPDSEDRYGRLSMWRAYGGNQSVAVVLNTDAFISETDILHANIYPVSYLNPEEFNENFFGISTRMEENIEFLKTLTEESVLTILFELFRGYAVSVKHPGFAEEKEWRVVYMPTYKASKHIKMEILSLNGLPQEVCKIPLKDFPEEGFTGASIPKLVNRIIIGPNDDQVILHKSFVKLLESAGCKNASKMVFASGIPLR
jgi:hypothetical protein